MTTIDAERFVERVRDDEDFAADLTARSDDPEAVFAFVLDSGFDVTPEELRDVFLEVYGDRLSEEQLAAIAGGMSGGIIAVVTLSAVGIAGAAVGAAAAAA